MPEPMIRAVGGARRTSQGSIPYNNLATYTSTVDANHPGNQVLANDPGGAPYRLPSGVGNLIDPVASKLMQYFPEPNYSGPLSPPSIASTRERLRAETISGI